MIHEVNMYRLNLVIVKNSIIISVNILAIIFGLFTQGYSQNTSFSVHAVSDLKRVFDKGYNLPPISDTIKLFGIKGEIISGQCVVNAKSNLSDVTVELSRFRNKKTGALLPSNSVEWNFVGSIPLTTNAPNQPEYAIVRKAPAMFPDYLIAETQLNIPKGRYQAVWLTLNIPVNVTAGSYEGTVTVVSMQGRRSLPIQIAVYPLYMPEERNLKIAEWYSTGGFEHFHGIDEKYSGEWFDMLRKYADNMVAHRQNVFQVPAAAIGISRSSKGILEFDFTRFDQIAEVFWGTGKMDYLETGELFRFGEGGWSGSEILPKNFNVLDLKTDDQITSPGKDVLPHLLPAIEDHLRQKGWLDKTVFHVKDEPSLHNALSWQKASRYIHQYAPDLQRADAIETTYVLKDIDIAIPKLDALASWYDDYKKSLEQGVELWFYTVGIYQGSLLPNKTIDMPLMDNRILHWLNYKYDATGFLHWGWNQWTEDPFNEVGKHLGDGWHVYPAKDGVLNSLRWEQMRNGIQDYEYLLMLEKKTSVLKDSLGSRFSWIDPKQRSKEISSHVVTDFMEYSDDAEVFYKAKMEVLKELMDFDESPGIYIQTKPLEGSLMTARSSVEVYGWVEPGTNILVNGKPSKVSDQGLFLEKIIISPTHPIIKVQANNDKGSKEIIRGFKVK